MEELARNIAILKESEYLMNSLVAFMVELLEQYVSGDISACHMADAYVRRLNMTKFHFMQMPKELAIKNLQVFSNELSLAQQLNAISLQAPRLENSEFDQKLLECIKDYAETYTVRKPAP